MCKKKGYMTVEASLVLPFVFIGIVFVIFTGFYLYDGAVMKQACYISALRGSQQKGMNQGQIEQYTKTEIAKLLEERLVAVRSMETKVEVSMTKVKVSSEISIHMPFFNFYSEKLKLWNVKAKAEASRVNPVTVIRGIRSAQEFTK